MAAVSDMLDLKNAIQTTPTLAAPGADVPATDTQFFNIHTASSNGDWVFNDASSHGESSSASEERWHLIGSLARSAATLQEYAGPGDVEDSVPNPFP